ncbi:transcription initiation factor IIB [Candidatus Bathyarchaeota archaeon]|jgi:transcription initiation factor TFIIB|nr:transcription initiation factor IIB [Candidatus Bathyarchaeota archaeon]MDP6048914.1 TFIIB-type zinc ribbon-containing protein [Candidatus Bathyarchaeota archaeon]MDP7443351.1 TFIIB-type zinc ribbon-containing protein [Candidatus Bathyarchaeota archaeon]
MKKNMRGCTKCGSMNIIADPEAGEEVCGQCGLVLNDEFIDLGPEWRAFTSAERETRTRVGMARSYTIYDMGLSTSFKGGRDARGNKLTVDTRNMMKKLKRYDTRSKLDDTWGRNLSIAMAELDRLSTVLSIPKMVKESAALIYRQALKADLIRGRSIDAFVAASLYAACRQRKVPRPLKGISKASIREHSEVSRSYRLLHRQLKLKMPIDDPMKFVSGIASKLNLKPDTERFAVDILMRAKERRGLSGKDPRGIAAAALYMACIEMDDKKIQKEVASAAGTTEVTLRNRLKGLEVTLRDRVEINEELTVTPPAP